MFKSILVSACCVIVLSTEAITPSTDIQAVRTVVAAQYSADSGCCETIGMGNFDGSVDGLVTMSDLTIFLDHLFINYLPLDCMEAGNMDLSADNQVTMGDLTVLLDHLFINYEPLPECPPLTVTDVDGNVYGTVTIGTQVWMTENLKVTHYRNGDSIPNVTDNVAWPILSTGAYCDYYNDTNYVSAYGRLYNWYAVDDSRKIAPAGWHVPTDEEWKTLEMYLGMSQSQADTTQWRGTNEGGKLKETGTARWIGSDASVTNESGFTAVPGGYRAYSGPFYNMRWFGAHWSSTGGSGYYSIYAYYRGLWYDKSTIDRSFHDKTSGLSVRCVMD